MLKKPFWTNGNKKFGATLQRVIAINETICVIKECAFNIE